MNVFVQVQYGPTQVPINISGGSLKGYLLYTDSIENDLKADTQVWGGAGIGFSY